MDKSMRYRRDFLTPAIVIFGILIVILALWVVIAGAQTHTMPGSNVVPRGASVTPTPSLEVSYGSAE